MARPLDRRSFRDACAAARLRMWPPEKVSVATNLRELIVGWLISPCDAHVEVAVLRTPVTSAVACQALAGAIHTELKRY